MDAVKDNYQSNGLCHDTCVNLYAFAVVQGSSCWCSNYTPAQTLSTGSCSEPCPGYPAEKCGAPAAGLFGYLALDRSPSGTVGLATTSPSSTVQTVSSSSLDRGAPSPSTFSLQVRISTVFVQLPPSIQLSVSTSFISLQSSLTTLHVLTSSSAQPSMESPSAVTVLATVTASASPSIQISIISIV